MSKNAYELLLNTLPDNEISSWADEVEMTEKSEKEIEINNQNNQNEKSNHTNLENNNFSTKEYVRGRLWGRLSHFENDKNNSDKLVIYTRFSEQNHMEELVRVFDKNATRISVQKLPKRRKIARYYFAITTSVEDFYNQIYNENEEVSPEFFHGLFDSTAIIEMNNHSRHLISLELSGESFSKLEEVAKTLYPELNLKTSITDYNELIDLYHAIYFDNRKKGIYKYIYENEDAFMKLSARKNNDNMNNKFGKFLFKKNKRKNSRKYNHFYNSHVESESIPNAPHNNSLEISVPGKNPLKISINKIHPDAKIPVAQNPGDIGYDLTAVHLLKIDEKSGVHFYGTGLQISIPPNMNVATMIFPRSSISKTNFMLANSIGLIDTDYRGELIIAMRPMCENPQPFNLPCRLAQLVFINCFTDVKFEEVTLMDETKRGTNGFGSTGDKN